MITAHLPAGYILGRALSGGRAKAEILWPAMLGAVLPDIDLLYYYFVDQGQVHHHLYPAHWPLFWLGLCLLPALTAAGAGQVRLLMAILAFLGGALLHLALDTIASPVYWLMPFDQAPVELVQVPARYGHWAISFLLHWTFLIELSIWILAATLYFRRPTRRRIFAPRPGANSLSLS